MAIIKKFNLALQNIDVFTNEDQDESDSLEEDEFNPEAGHEQEKLLMQQSNEGSPSIREQHTDPGPTESNRLLPEAEERGNNMEINDQTFRDDERDEGLGEHEMEVAPQADLHENILVETGQPADESPLKLNQVKAFSSEQRPARMTDPRRPRGPGQLEDDEQPPQ